METKDRIADLGKWCEHHLSLRDQLLLRTAPQAKLQADFQLDVAWACSYVAFDLARQL